MRSIRSFGGRASGEEHRRSVSCCSRSRSATTVEFVDACGLRAPRGATKTASGRCESRQSGQQRLNGFDPPLREQGSGAATAIVK